MKTTVTLIIGGAIGWYSHAFIMQTKSVVNTVKTTKNQSEYKEIAFAPQKFIISPSSNIDKNIIYKAADKTTQKAQSAAIDLASPENLMLQIDTLTASKNYTQALFVLNDLLSQIQNIYPEQRLKKLFTKLVKLQLQHIDSTTTKIDFLNEMLHILPNNFELRFLLAQELVKVQNYIEASYQISFLEYDLDWKEKFETIKQQIDYAALFLNGEISIPLAQKHNVWHIKVVINGKPANFILDTGASVTTISHQFINTTTGQIVLNTANGQIKTTSAIISSFMVDEIIKTDFFVATLPVDKLPPGVDGLLGLDWLNTFHFIIDAKNQTLQLRNK